MLLYLSTPENEALFSKSLEEQGVFMDFIDITRYTSLVAALSHNRALPNYEYIVFHFPTVPETEPVLEAVTHIRRFYHARVIVFAPQGTKTTELFAELAGMGLRELVPVGEDTDLQAELRECMSQDGKGFLNSVEIAAAAGIETAQAKIRPKLTLPQGSYLTLGLAGTQTRTGTTTQAFCFFHALKALGLFPCIIDRKRAFVQMLASLYPDEMVIDGSLFSMRGITFANDIQIGTAHNIFIIDYGVLSPETANDFKDCNLRILCSGAKAWELPHLVTCLTGNPDTAQHVIFSFVSTNDEKEIGFQMSDSIPYAIAPWTPGIWNAESAWHERFLLPMVREAACN